MTIPLPLKRLPLLLAVVLLVAAGLGWQLAGRGRGAPAPAVYVALGASDAVGVGALRPAQEGWVPQVHSRLPAGTQLVNLGISGATLAEVSDRQLPVALDAAPRLVTIWPGANDLRAGVDLPTFTTRLDAILGRLRRERGGEVTLVVLNLPDLRSVPVFASAASGVRDRQALDARVRAWNAAIAESAGRHDAILVDLYGRWSELAERPDFVSADGFHPSGAGYRRIAELVLADLERNNASSLR